MKIFLVVLAVIAAVVADISELPSNEYLAPVSQEYLPPVAVDPVPAHSLGEDGYSYKVPEALRRRFRYRVRRDVSEIAAPSNEYLPPVKPEVVIAESEPAHVLTEEGYVYNNPVEARRRYRIRRRRDVSEIVNPSNEYLPPVEALVEPEPAHVLTEEGYVYNNPVEARRRHRIRRRRDVSEIVNPSNEYLPPVEALVEPEPAHVLTEEGYVYNNPVEARRRYRIRRRRDVSELASPSNEYLPPVQPEVVIAEPEPAHALTEEGYVYNNPVEARRRHRIRRRRDVSEIVNPSNEYLPPVEALVEPEPAHVLTEEGYVYNNPVEARRRYRIRRRRDVSELASPSNEYLPPVQPEVVIAEPEPAHALTEEGYVYNSPVEARRRYRIRRRRDVSEIVNPSNEYLPPVEALVEPEPAHVLTEEGYVYNNPVEARRRYRIRRRRDVSELASPSNEYLPPVQPEVVIAEPEPAHALTEEGYVYNNPVEARRRYRIRRRRDVSEIVNPSNEYLPPVEALVEPEPAHILTEEGYVYNNPGETRRRYRIRRRRSVPAPV